MGILHPGQSKNGNEQKSYSFRLLWSNDNVTSFRAAAGHLVLLARSWVGMESNNTKLKKPRSQEGYILVTLVLFLFSYGCAMTSGLSESEVQSEQSPAVVVYEHPTEPIVSDSPALVKKDNRGPVSSSAKALSKEDISQLQARLKAAGFDPGPIDGILGSKTRSLILRVQMACTILKDLATANKEFFASAAETQAAALTTSANTLSKADIQLLQKRLKAVGFYPALSMEC
jgi:hypothetical protein